MRKNNKNLKHILFKQALFETYSGFNKQQRGFIKSHFRSATIHETFIGFLFFMHNGKTFKPVEITDEMVGHKFGEFCITRTSKHKLNKKKSKKVSKSKKSAKL
jgi:small subunit ribosomal protein S19